MSVLPKKSSWNWAWVFGIHAVVLIAAILVSRAVLHLAATIQTSTSLAILAVSLALIAAAGGWMGRRLFFLCSAAGSIVGAVYMLCIAFTNASSGWSDLTSIIALMLLSVAGICAGMIMELIHFLITRKKKDSR